MKGQKRANSDPNRRRKLRMEEKLVSPSRPKSFIEPFTPRGNSQENKKRKTEEESPSTDVTQPTQLPHSPDSDLEDIIYGTQLAVSGNDISEENEKEIEEKDEKEDEDIESKEEGDDDGDDDDDEGIESKEESKEESDEEKEKDEEENIEEEKEDDNNDIDEESEEEKEKEGIGIEDNKKDVNNEDTDSNPKIKNIGVSNRRKNYTEDDDTLITEWVKMNNYDAGISTFRTLSILTNYTPRGLQKRYAKIRSKQREQEGNSKSTNKNKVPCGWYNSTEKGKRATLLKLVVGELMRVHGITRNEAIHALYVTSGDPRLADRYLCGNLSDMPWSNEDDKCALEDREPPKKSGYPYGRSKSQISDRIHFLKS